MNQKRGSTPPPFFFFFFFFRVKSHLQTCRPLAAVVARANLGLVIHVLATWIHWKTLSPLILPHLQAEFLLYTDFCSIIYLPDGRCRQRKVGFLFWSAQPPVPTQAVDNSPAKELEAGCVIPATLPTGPGQQQWSGLGTGWLQSVVWESYKQCVMAGLERSPKGNWSP